jgi:hypothetical protein
LAGLGVAEYLLESCGGIIRNPVSEEERWLQQAVAETDRKAVGQELSLEELYKRFVTKIGLKSGC